MKRESSDQGFTQQEKKGAASCIVGNASLEKDLGLERDRGQATQDQKVHIQNVPLSALVRRVGVDTESNDEAQGDEYGEHNAELDDLCRFRPLHLSLAPRTPRG